MAKVYLDSGDNFTLSGAASVFGSSGTEKLIINSGVTGVVVDQNVERVDLPGASSAYTFQQAGNQLKVLSGATVVATIPLQDDTDGTQVVFTNGSVSAKVGATGMTLGGAAVTSTAAAVTPTTIDATVTSGSGSSTGGTTTGQTFSLTTSNDALAMTAGNDTVTGAAGTLASTDVISDSSTTDTDSLTASVTVATLAPIVTKVENVNINGQFVTTGLDLTNVTGAKVATFNTGIVAGTATVGTTTAGGGVRAGSVEKIVLGSNIATATINADTASTGTAGVVAVDAGSVTTLTMAGTSSADSYAITTNGNLTFSGSTTVETLKLNPTVAGKTIVLDGAAAATQTIDYAGAVAGTIKGVVTGKTITKSGAGALTIEVDQTTASDLSKVALDAVTLTAAMNNTLTLGKSGVGITTALDQTALTIVAPAASSSTNSVTLTNSAATQTSITTTDVKTLNLVSAATQVAGVDATYTTLNAGTNNVVATGTNDVKVTSGTAKSFDASGLVGSLTYTQAASATTTVKGGSAANTVTFANTTVDGTYVGRDGGDVVTVVNTTGAMTITTGAGADTITATGAIAGAGALSLDLGAGNDTVTATALTTGVISGNLGAGDDTVTLGTGVTGAAVVAIDGGAGTDVVKFGAAANISAGTLSLTNVEAIALSATGTMTFSAAQLSGSTLTVKGTNTVATDILAVTGVAGTTTIDLSTLTMDQTVSSAMSKTTITATASTAAVTIKGTAVADTISVSANGSTITAGAGADSLTLAGGTDKVVYTAATGAALRTESAGALGANATTAPVATAGTAGDVIGSFTNGTDKIVLSVALGTAGASTGLVASGGTSYTAASTALAAEDFLTTNLGAASTAITANTAGGGRFIFDTVGKLLIYDASGDSAISAGGAYTAGAADDFVVAVTTGVTLLATDFAFV